MSVSPEVSVIVPAHNATATIGMQLEALATQTDAPLFEVIVADNRSVDDLRGVLELWGESFDRLVLVDGSKRLGAAWARNVGATFARAEKLLFCDADDIVAADWVERGSRVLDGVEIFSGSAIPVPDSHFRGRSVADVRREIPDSGDDLVIPTGPVAYPILMGGNFGIRAGLFHELGGFDESLPGFVEDNDLANRVQLSGRVIPSAQGVRIAYRGNPDEEGEWSLASAGRIRRRSYGVGRAHMILCHKYRLMTVSPALQGRRWRTEAVRAGLRLVGEVVRGCPDPASLTRMWIGIGYWAGWVGINGDVKGLVRHRRDGTVVTGTRIIPSPHARCQPC